MKLVATYQTYCSIFWQERHIPRYLENVSTVTPPRRRTGVETAPNHQPYVDAAPVPLMATHHSTGLRNGFNHRPMRTGGVSRNGTSLNWGSCTH